VEHGFGRASKGFNEVFIELFGQTFDNDLVPNHPLARATELAAAAGHPEGLSALRSSFWGTGTQIAAIHDIENIGEEAR